nr:zinc transporter ZIP10 [Ciona intestinalis]|eukprot:XP_009862239.1 zinc transporter ZIP10 [Ciona intestinalis]
MRFFLCSEQLGWHSNLNKKTYLTWNYRFVIGLVALTFALASHEDSETKQTTLSNLTQTSKPNLIITSCTADGCIFQVNTTQVLADEFIKYTEIVFKRYSMPGFSYINIDGLNHLLIDLGVEETTSDDHDHDHDDHDDHDEYAIPEYYSYDENNIDYDNIEKPKCRKAIDILSEYYPYVNAYDVRIGLDDFITILPNVVDSVYECRNLSLSKQGADKHEHSSQHSTENRGKVWGIAILSVTVISVLSVIGILIVPLMRHNDHFNRLISFLVALAVGTLTGDALLHLLPHAMGEHNHTSADHAHDHGNEDKNKEKEKLMKSLVAVVGMYMFFVMESLMGIARQRKNMKKMKNEIPNPIKVSPTDSSVGSPIKSDVSFSTRMECTDSLLIPETDLRTNKDGSIITCLTNNHFPGTCSNEPNNASKSAAGDCPEIKIANGHRNGDHTHGHTHHNHEDLLKSEGVKDLAWMIIMGDGLHNFSDGLAIGAAFSSSIAAGLGTSLAVFCHELPHELGDFAILIKAGMSIKKAILYNGLCACMAFIGAILGLVVGEYTTSVKLWLLAITAGGFLYIALVDMLPTMKESTLEGDSTVRFILQNIGFMFGVFFMLLIAMYEENFANIF